MEHIIKYSNYQILNEKKRGQEYDYGCVMAYMSEDIKDLYKNFYDIDEDDIYNNDEDEYGLEIEPHVTLLYGLHSDVDEDHVVNLLRVLKRFPIIFEGISLFEKDEYDVLKWDVYPEQLSIINNVLKSTFKHTEDFPDYNPHSTIAYLKPGMGKKYIVDIKELIDNPIDPIFLEYYVYSMSDGGKIKINEDGEIDKK